MPRDHGGCGHKNQKMSDILSIAQKFRRFLILVPKSASLLAKIVQHSDGTSGAKCGSSADPTLPECQIQLLLSVYLSTYFI